MSSIPEASYGGTAEVVIRPAGAADLGSVVAIEEEAFTADRISRRSFRRLLASPSASVLVAETADALVGCCVVLFRSYSSRARLYSLAVIARAAGRGLGSRLLAAGESAAVERGSSELSLEVRKDNAGAIGLYRRSGYGLIGETPGYYSDGAAALHFRKRLGGAAAA